MANNRCQACGWPRGIDGPDGNPDVGCTPCLIAERDALAAELARVRAPKLRKAVVTFLGTIWPALAIAAGLACCWPGYAVTFLGGLPIGVGLSALVDRFRGSR